MLWIFAQAQGITQQYASNMLTCASRITPCFWSYRTFSDVNVGVQVFGSFGGNIASKNAPNIWGDVGAKMGAEEPGFFWGPRLSEKTLPTLGAMLGLAQMKETHKVEQASKTVLHFAWPLSYVAHS